MHYFVTGATGFIGGYLTSQLLAEGHLVSALVRTPEQARALAAYGVRPHVGDVLDKESMHRGMRGTDGVFHLAAYVKIGTPHRRWAEAVNVGGTRNVLELMRDLRIPKGVYTSTLAINGDTRGRMVDETYHHRGRALSVYAGTKWQAHHEVAVPLMRRGLPLVIVMPGAVYGPQNRGDLGALLTTYLRGRLPAAPTRSAFCWAHVADVAHGHLVAMEGARPGETYMICGPPHPLRHALGLAGRLVGKRHPPLPLPWWLLRPVAEAARAGALLVPALRGPAERLRLGSGVTQLGDDVRARSELGFSRRSLEEGMPDTARGLLEEVFAAV